MSIHRLFHAIALSVLAFFLTGCYSYQNLDVRVIDATTNKPLKGASVKAHATVYLNPFPPEDSEAVTNENGSSHVRVAMSNGPAYVTVKLEGYESKDHLLNRNQPDLMIELERHVSGGDSVGGNPH